MIIYWKKFAILGAKSVPKLSQIGAKMIVNWFVKRLKYSKLRKRILGGVCRGFEPHIPPERVLMGSFLYIYLRISEKSSTFARLIRAVSENTNLQRHRARRMEPAGPNQSNRFVVPDPGGIYVLCYATRTNDSFCSRRTVCSQRTTDAPRRVRGVCDEREE